MTSTPVPEPEGTVIHEDEAAHAFSDHKDLFLDALLRPDEHFLKLSNIRHQVTLLCHVSKICYRHLERELVDLEHFRDLVRCTIRSLRLLQSTGMDQASPILLADDPTRTGEIRLIELDILDLEATK